VWENTVNRNYKILGHSFVIEDSKPVGFNKQQFYVLPTQLRVYCINRMIVAICLNGLYMVLLE